MKSLPCDPEIYAHRFDKIAQELRVAKTVPAAKLQEKRDCLFGYLNDYIDFSSAQSSSRTQVERLYNKTLKMIDGAILAREMQEVDVEEQRDYALAELVEMGVRFTKKGKPIEPVALSSRWHDTLNLFSALHSINETIKGFEEDRDHLNEIKSSCKVLNLNHEQKVVCIETFVNATHSRGPYLSTGCKLPMPERILESHGLTQHEHTELSDLGKEATTLTKNVLDCLARS